MFNKKKVASCELRVASCESPLPLRAYSLQPTVCSLRRPRRGVLLLVVLSMLVLFLMIGTAFIVVARHSEQSAKILNRASRNASTIASEGRLLDEVLLQLTRDTHNGASSLRFHSLLNDMYGNDGWTSEIPPADTALAGLLSPYLLVPRSNNPNSTPAYTVRWPDNGLPTNDPAYAANVTGGQMLEFDILRVGDLYGNQSIASIAAPLLDAYAGQVLTFTTGAARGRSTRIVSSVHAPAASGNWVTLRVMAFPLANGSELPADADQLQRALAGSKILVNGRPFNGTGVGMNINATTGPRLNSVDSTLGLTPAPEIALLPNAAALSHPVDLANAVTPPNYFPGIATQKQYIFYDYNGRGGADESYDLPDFQNMSLALIPAPEDGNQLQETVWEDPASPPPNHLGRMIMPSFHRPDLVNYWKSRVAELPTNHALLRRILLRPSWFDHPGFTGSNPDVAPLAEQFSTAFAASNTSQIQQASEALLNRMIFGPWDVDNDNDGVRDSVWIDFGAPVMAGPNGKLVKPLAAVLCIDLDGRLNVNAHGSLDLAGEFDIDAPPDPNTGGSMRYPGANGNNGPEIDNTPRGFGFGPADISLEPAIGDDNFKWLLDGNNFGGLKFPGRYGFKEAAGGQRSERPGRFGMDVINQIEKFGWPQWANVRSSFGTPPDLRARYGIGVNAFGQPMYEANWDAVNGNPVGGLLVDSPYELNLSAKTARGVTGADNGAHAADAPFSLAELERTLRVYDFDAPALPARLSYLAGVETPGGVSNGVSDRLKITTESFEVPVPSVGLPEEMRGMLTSAASRRLPQSTAELIETRVRYVLFNRNLTKAFPAPLGAASNDDFVRPLDQLNDAGKVHRIVRQLLAPELAAGLRLDINRPLGNGRDDNNNGVVDEPGEADLDGNGKLDAGEGELMWPAMAGAGAANAAFAAARFAPLDADGDGQIDAAASPGAPGPAQVPGKFAQDSLLQRQLLARHLYVMALTVSAPTSFGTTTTGASALDDQLLARRLAQWAINVVDFRDADNIMSAFEYDPNPFDGWGLTVNDQAVPIDGDPGTTVDHVGPDGQAGTEDDNLVWGAERPELVMTETLTWHDRRTDDGAQEENYPYTSDPAGNLMKTPDPDDPKRDQDYDQLLRPKGAAFVELYNPWAANPGAGADTHFLRRPNAGSDEALDMGVNLSAVAVDPNNQALRSPVWRMTIHKRVLPRVRRATEVEDTVNWDPDDPNPENRPVGAIDRTVYFAGFDPEKVYSDLSLTWDNDGVAFFNDANRRPIPPVRPGRYMVVGSGDDFDGDGVYESPIGDRKNRGEPGPVRRLELAARATNHTVAMKDIDNIAVRDDQGMSVQAPSEGNGATLRVEGDSSQCITDVAIIDQVWDEPDNYDDRPDGQAGLRTRRWTVSEPARGYVTKFRSSIWSDKNQQYVISEAPNSNRSRSIDIPLDGPIGGQAQLDANLGGAAPPPYLRDGVDEVLCKIRHADPARATPAEERGDPGATYAYIYLQRLANPLLPWNPLPATGADPRANGHDPERPVNPYLTVDATNFNLTVFNSRGDDQGREENDMQANEPRNNFASVERGYAAFKQNAQFMPTLFNQEPPTLVRRRPGASLLQTTRQSDFRRMQLKGNSQFNFQAIPYHSLGFLNQQYQDPAAAGEMKQVRPQRPFEWLAWNNRPYTSANELLLVPRSRSSKMLRDFTSSHDAGQGLQSPFIDALDPMPSPNQANPKKFPFGHLENFFYSAPDNPRDPLRTGVPQNLVRILDYVGTPTLFAGGETWLNPQRYSRLAAPVSTTLDPRYNRQTPFNSVSEYREPGRINLNTIPGREVWSGLFHGRPKRGDGNRDDDVHPGPDDDEFAASRRGYGPNGDSTLLLNGAYPSIFANPFRAATAGDLVPLANMVRSPVNVTIARTLGDTNVPGKDPQGDFLFGAITEQPYNHSMSNAYFRYAPMTRMGSMTTTRSNVYAVWVTIGFFEVQEIQDGGADPKSTAILANFGGSLAAARSNRLFSKVYPDGVILGKEAGADVGEQRRLRGFYVVDRSIPVGFKPGENNNVENAVRLRRRIE